jgi:hypothetical protein
MQSASMQDFMIRISRQVNYLTCDTDADETHITEPGKLIICMSAYCTSSSAALEEAIAYMGDAEDFQVSVSPGPERLDYATLMRGLPATPAPWHQRLVPSIPAIVDTSAGFAMEQDVADQSLHAVVPEEVPIPVVINPRKLPETSAAIPTLTGISATESDIRPSKTTSRATDTAVNNASNPSWRDTLNRWRDVFRNRH